MQTRVAEFLEELRSAWRFRAQALAVAWIVGILGWAVVLVWPDRYQANARIFVDTRTALKPVLQGLVVEQDVNAQLNYVRQSLLGAPELEKIATDVGLLTPRITNRSERADIIDKMRARVVITVRSAGGDPTNDHDTGGSMYGVIYRDRLRDRSLKVVAELLKTLMEDTLGGKRQGSREAQKFLETQIKEYEVRLGAAEQRLANFKKTNVGVMPAEEGGYFPRLQTEIDAVRTTENALTVAMSRRDEINRQLRGEAAATATASVASSQTGQNAAAGGGDVLGRIRETQAKLDELLLKFTEMHPDVIATRKVIEELKQRRELELQALRQGDPEAVATSGAGANPVYQSMELARNQANVEIAILRQQLDAHRARVADLRKALDTMPQVEAEFAQLNRDYDVNKTQFTALLTQLEKARLGQEADLSGAVRFEVVEPPNADYKPVTPPRSAMIVAVLLLALGAGGSVAYVRHKLLPVFWSAKTLAAQTGAMVLGVVTFAFPDSRLASARRALLWYSTSVSSLVLVGIAVFGLSHSGLRIVLPGID
jgi:polysaccharide chain length determinant protein (PEP-CTERM system associated)